MFKDVIKQVGKKQKRRDVSLVRDLQAQGKTPYSKMVTKLVLLFCLFGNRVALNASKLFFTSVTEVTRISVQPLYFTNHTPTVLYNQKYKEYEITKNVEISTK